MASLWSEQQVLAMESKAAGHDTSETRTPAERGNEPPLSKRTKLHSEHEVQHPHTISNKTASQPLAQLAYNVFANGVKAKLHTQQTCGVFDAMNDGDPSVSVEVTNEDKITAINQTHKNLDSKKIESFVLFDMETGGKWHHEDDILQIVAKHGDQLFNVYIQPTKRVRFEVSLVNKLTAVNVDDQMKLYHKGIPVGTVNCLDALLQFITFLEDIPNPVLVGHNIRGFDLRFLYVKLKEYGLWEKFTSVVPRFVDTLTAFKKEYPNQGSHTQAALVKEMLGETYEEHNCLEDVKALEKLFLYIQVQDKFSEGMLTVFEFDFLMRGPERKETFQPIIDQKLMSENIAKKIAKAGYNFSDLKLAYENNREEGLRALLGDDENGILKVTKHKPSISKICAYFEKN